MAFKNIACVALLLSLQVNALLIETFTNNKLDFVPGLGLGNTLNGYIYTYTSPSSAVSPSLAALQNGTAFGPNGLAVTFSISAGTISDQYPFAGVGFDWVNAGSSGPKIPLNLTGNTSVIVQYASTAAINLEWAQGDPENGTEFVCVLPASPTALTTHTCILGTGLGGFAQPNWTVPAEIRTFNIANAVGFKFSYKVPNSQATLTLRSLHLNNTLEEWPMVSSSSQVVVPVSSSQIVVPPSSSSQAVVPVSSSQIIVPPSSSSQAILPISSSAISAGPDIVWIPSFSSQVRNPLTLGGYWYTYNDAQSNPPGNSIANPASTLINSVIATENSLLASFTLNTGFSHPFAAIGFDWNDNGTGAIKTPVSLATKTALCIDYELTDGMSLILKQAGRPDNGVDFQFSLPAGARTVRTIPFTSFALPSWAPPADRYPLDLTQQIGVHIQYKDRPVSRLPLTAQLRIHAVGFNNACGTPVSISSSVIVSSSSRAGISSGPLLSSSSSPLGVSSAILISSSSVAQNATCNTLIGVLPIRFCADDNGNGIVNWADDDNGNGVLNYQDSTSPYFVPISTAVKPILGNLASRGFGFVSMNNRELVIRLVDPGRASLQVFTLDGQLVATPFAAFGHGEVVVPWNGQQLRQGVYLFRLVQGKEVVTVRGVLVQ